MPGVLAYHLVITAYGFWLPNDPRGSWSDFVGAWELLRFGRATKTDTRRSVASRPHDRKMREEAKNALKYAPVVFNGLQARAIARGFADFAAKSGLIVWACAIMADHTHLVVARHGYKIEQVANLLKGAATTRLADEGIHPFQGLRDAQNRRPKAWAVKEWKVFLDCDANIRRAIDYVERNPEKEGLARQTWKFVGPYGV